MRDDLKDEFVDPVCRDVLEQAETQNAVMDDVVKDKAGSCEAPVQGGQGTTAVTGSWFEADYVKPQPW